MIRNDIGRNSPPSADFIAAADTRAAKREALQNQAATLAEILSGSKDVVEISDAARTLFSSFRDSAPATRSAAAESLNSREGRDTVAKNYNAVLDDLRSQYDEEEAMRRFDAFMESEGFERVTEESHGMRPSGGLSGVLRAFAGGGISDFGMPHIKGVGPLTSNLSANSSIKGAFVNGDVRYLAETYANYGANANQDVFDALEPIRLLSFPLAVDGSYFDTSPLWRRCHVEEQILVAG